jgi:hypothetical protein
MLDVSQISVDASPASKPRSGRPTPLIMDAAEHQAQLGDHGAWLSNGRSLLAAADRLWPAIQAAIIAYDRQFDELRRQIEALRAAGQNTPVQVSFPVNPEPVFQAVSPYFLLAGFAVEALLKAVRVKRVGPGIQFGNSRDALPTNHQYEQFALAELGSLTDEETRLLCKLGLFVRWAGRYPVAIKPPPVDEANGRSLYSGDADEIRALTQRIIDKYESLT